MKLSHLRNVECGIKNKRNEHKGVLQKEVFENRKLRYDRFKKS